MSAAPGTGGYSSVLALRRSPKRSDQTQMTQLIFFLSFSSSSFANVVVKKAESH